MWILMLLLFLLKKTAISEKAKLILTQTKRTAYINSLEKYIKFKEGSIFFNITKLKILQRYSNNYSKKILRESQGNCYQKLYQTKTKTKQLQDSNWVWKNLMQRLTYKKFAPRNIGKLSNFRCAYDHSLYNEFNELPLWHL